MCVRAEQTETENTETEAEAWTERNRKWITKLTEPNTNFSLSQNCHE